MNIGVLKEKIDTRVALVPETVGQLIKAGNTVLVEKGAGEKAFFDDEAYKEVGATITERAKVLGEAGLIPTVEPLEKSEQTKLQDNVLLFSLYQPFANPSVVEEIAVASHTAFSLDMIPRTTLAQSMDVLSSMASISGYRAVLKAASMLPRYFPMLSTAAGSIAPSKVLILGAGVAGLQAIATAKRLGAVVEAFDTRLAAKEEVESLGAKFVQVEGAKDDKSAGGYAVQQSEEYLAKQAAIIQEKSQKADVIITTALIRGAKAPVLVKKPAVERMRPGSVIIDLAAVGGGNCELTENNKTVVHKGVSIVGNSSLPTEMPMHASQLFSKNIFNLLKTLLKDGEVSLNFENEIISGACILHEGKPFEKEEVAG